MYISTQKLGNCRTEVGNEEQKSGTMLTKSRIIVLHTLKYNDDSIIAHALTEQQGCQSFLIRISRSPRAAIRHTLFQPLALLEAEWEHRSEKSLIRLKAAHICVTHTSIPYDPYKATTAIFLSEFMYHALRNEPPSRILFEYIFSSVEWLDTATHSFANFHLVFLLRLTKYLGFFPEVPPKTDGQFFDLEKCTFVSTPPQHQHFLDATDTARLPILLRMRYETMHLFRFSGAERSRFLSALNTFYRLHLPGFPELRSLNILREVFNG